MTKDENGDDLSNVKWDAISGTITIKNITHAVLYDDPPRPTGWRKLNPFVWYRYFRDRGKLIAYWEVKE